MIVQRHGDLEIGYDVSRVGSGFWAGGPAPISARINASFPWRALGHVMSPRHPVSQWRSHGFGGLMIRDRSARNVLLAHPVDCVRVGSAGTHGWAIWRQIPPEGFVALVC